MLAFVLGFVAPFALGIYLSFCKFTTVTDARWVGISNYLKICNDKEFIHALWYTVLFTVVSVILINVLAFTVAMRLRRGFGEPTCSVPYFSCQTLLAALSWAISGSFC